MTFNKDDTMNTWKRNIINSNQTNAKGANQMSSAHISFLIHRFLRRPAMLDVEEAHILLNLKTSHISSSINQQRDRECLHIVRGNILEYELLLQSLYPYIPNKHVNAPVAQRNGKGGNRFINRSYKRQPIAIEEQEEHLGDIQQMISPCDMSQRYMRKLSILDEEEQEFHGWGQKQDSSGLMAVISLFASMR